MEVQFTIFPMPAIASFNVAKTDFNEAKSNYLKLCTYEDNFTESLSLSSFKSPFDEETYTLIKSDIQELILEADSLTN